MSDYKMYEVFVPISGAMRIHLRAKDKDEAVQNGFKIAKDIEKDSTDTMIPNLFSWRVDVTDDIAVIEKGDADE